MLPSPTSHGHGMVEAAMTPAELCWLSPGSSIPGSGHTTNHSSATKPPQESVPGSIPAHPTPLSTTTLQGLVRLFIDSSNEGRGSISSPAHLHKDPERRRGEGRREPELNPPPAQAGAGRRPRFINTFKGSD